MKQLPPSTLMDAVVLRAMVASRVREEVPEHSRPLTPMFAFADLSLAATLFLVMLAVQELPADKPLLDLRRSME